VCDAVIRKRVMLCQLDRFEMYKVVSRKKIAYPDNLFSTAAHSAHLVRQCGSALVVSNVVALCRLLFLT